MMSSESPGADSPRDAISGAFPFVSILTTAEPIFFTTSANEADSDSPPIPAGASEAWGGFWAAAGEAIAAMKNVSAIIRAARNPSIWKRNIFKTPLKLRVARQQFNVGRLYQMPLEANELKAFTAEAELSTRPSHLRDQEPGYHPRVETPHLSDHQLVSHLMPKVQARVLAVRISTR